MELLFNAPRYEMTSPQKKMKIGSFFSVHGGHVASWLMPTVTPADAQKLSYWQNLARWCEVGKLDFLFLADSNRVQYQRNPAAMRHMAATPLFEPVTLLSALAATTEHLGLVATMTTTYTQPFSVARFFGSLDHVSSGRASWNVVTSTSGDEAPNFQAQKHLPHQDRYARAREFLKITFGLWDSWEDDAFPFDKETGTYLIPEKMHYLNHSTEQFSVKGPLNLPRPPQGRPVIFQAGSSETGRDFGAEMADALFTAQENIKGAQEFYSDVKRRVVEYGRQPEHLPIFVGIAPIVGRTREEAQEKYDLLQSKVTPEVAIQVLSEVLTIDLRGFPLDEVITDLPQNDGMKSRRDLLLAKAIKERMTLLDLARFVAGGRGHRQIIGTPEMIADDFQEWFESGACDGFLLAPSHLPDSIEDFVTLVVPELQRRGLFRTEYEGKTLRENLGIPRPVHPAAAQ
jgi:FMN-dependent oxidoreductase (nitrilotriacetate monooxygenase family)